MCAYRHEDEKRKSQAGNYFLLYLWQPKSAAGDNSIEFVALFAINNNKTNGKKIDDCIR